MDIFSASKPHCLLRWPAPEVKAMILLSFWILRTQGVRKMEWAEWGKNSPPATVSFDPCIMGIGIRQETIPLAQNNFPMLD